VVVSFHACWSNLSPRWIGWLSHARFKAGQHNALDAEIMVYAARHDYVALKNDLVEVGALVTRRRTRSLFAT
jgi:predicted nuclease of predicted toxin-antitoxin system